ncbi:hypothetical protein SLEP1_g22516 [Rubroshorea leprosula]|uniref:Choline monooxygenase, chloroplastic n=1 Tax=Rubroshorea leprosula TaxID=152421 RepID=A0AAV5JKC7_9ROSI|nr:hypothetical protein SLEP1_g22516 [Rubroshorea leprosula]
MLLLKPIHPNRLFRSHTPPREQPKKSSSYALRTVGCGAQRLVLDFDPKIPIEKAVTPPSSWYTDPSFYSLELQRVFYRGWQAVGYTEQIKEPHDFFTGRLGDVEFVVCRDDKGKIGAFHNVCRHHASLLASGSGKKSCFVCPYHIEVEADDPKLLHSYMIDVIQLPTTYPLYQLIHLLLFPISFIFLKALLVTVRNQLGNGNFPDRKLVSKFLGWTYGLDGALCKATRITGIQNFSVNDFRLIPLKVATWGPFVLLNIDKEVSPKQEVDNDIIAHEWLGSCSELLCLNGADSSLAYLCRREYTIECNWKVFVDNYLDGGYHVPYAHQGLASGLKLDSYSTTIYEKVSIQSCGGCSVESEDDFDRLGSKAFYAFIYPNFMINRYGPWMDTNLVIPLGPRKCLVVFDYFLEASLKDDQDFINRSLVDSERVQMEDITLCEGVQRGLESPAYCCGRYAPTVEMAMHHFHCLLYDNLVK